MITPGSNLLEDALDLIDSQTFQYRKYLGSTEDDAGRDASAFDDPIDLEGSVQPVPRSAFMNLGLEYKRSYITIYSSNNIGGLDRDYAGDQIIFNGRTYNAVDENDWKSVDGWAGVIFVEVKS
tara:strand:+ start:1231 stop:1599 length:369 start_codon:yes stop_codon:yes gene_type:complete